MGLYWADGRMERRNDRGIFNKRVKVYVAPFIGLGLYGRSRLVDRTIAMSLFTIKYIISVYIYGTRVTSIKLQGACICTFDAFGYDSLQCCRYANTSSLTLTVMWNDTSAVRKLYIIGYINIITKRFCSNDSLPVKTRWALSKSTNVHGLYEHVNMLLSA